ncbi:hypothetical protein [Flagellimonas nanhaiensis]|uniref:Uncharacterized protein n=1 Tax=Flagellimonas nanhaiensis TaxID=2292706 RepID=A0A371JLL3_9FLAO|nr:hypothetical protein [Allomuricauda nanhaiensis]RDY57901.1 hypothetical protein DX873_17280 [Allomuricauda nanhaiensis]
MKKFFKVTYLALIAIFFSCTEDEKLTFEKVTDNIGTAGGLRTISLISPTIDLNNIEGSSWTIEVEQWDDQDGDLLQEVVVYAQFQDFTPGNGENNKPEVEVKTISASEFSLGPDGLPRSIIDVPASELISLLGLNTETEIDGGDIFRIRLELILTDGSVFSSGNLEGNITGVFFNSPFSYPANVVCELDESLFAGNYQMEYISGVFDAFGGANAFDDEEVTIVAASSTQRTVAVSTYLTSLGPFTGTLTFDLVCGRILVPNQSLSGAACSTAIVQQSGDNVGTFNPSDDSEFLVIFNDEITSDCGATPYEVVLRFTRI